MKRVAWFAGAAAVAATVLVLRQAWNGPTDDAGVVPPPVAEVAVPVASAIPVSSATTRVPRAVQAPASSEPPLASWDLCGVGRVPVPPGSPALAPGELPMLPDPVGREAFESARRRTIATLHAGAPRARAAGLIIGALSEPEPAHWAGMSVREIRAERAAALLQLGRDANDAVVLKWAHFMCPDDACRRVASRSWAAVDPDNGFAWGMLVQDDAANADVAWRGLVQASRWDSHVSALSAAMLAAVPRDEPAFLRLPLLIETIGVEAAMSIPALAIAGQRCKPTPPAGSASARDCDALARLLVEHGDTVLTLRQGSRIAKLAGWPDERLAEMAADQKALWAEYMRLSLDTQQPLNCASVDLTVGNVAAMARFGEVGALRERLRSASAPR